ncbi:MAG: class I SAM-dependent methyltransferase [Reichenbachiella sp.]
MESSYYQEYAELETSHWWFKARLEILSTFVNSNISETSNILNTGIATGQTTRMLEKYGRVTSLEYDKDCCEYLRKTMKIDVIEGSLTDLPFLDQSFDLVCAFDVIEHIEDDYQALNEIRRVLKKSGFALITVPAFQFLWSEHDVINQHYRRYNANDLKKRINSGMEIQYLSYFNSILFPPVLMARLVRKLIGGNKTTTATSDFQYFKGNNLINQILYQIFRIEKKLVGRIKMPFGISVIALCSPAK